MTNYAWVDGAGEILDRLYSGHFATYHFTEKLSDYMVWFAESLIRECSLTPESRILEIGCNSGRLLALFRELSGCSVAGVEPSKTFRAEWERQGLEVMNDYFSPATAEPLKKSEYDLIYFRHVFEHIPDPAPFIEAVSGLAGPKTRVVIEVPYLPTVIKRSRIENIGYSHLNYYCLQSIESLANRYGLTIFDHSLVETDGGSVVAHLKKGAPETTRTDSASVEEVSQFVDRIGAIRQQLQQELAEFPQGTVVGYGAGAKGQHLVHMLQLGNKISYIVDDTPELEHKLVPGTGLEIRSPASIGGEIQAVVNLVPTHAEAIREKVASQYKFIDPINGPI